MAKLSLKEIAAAYQEDYFPESTLSERMAASTCYVKYYTPKFGEYGTIIAQYYKAMLRHSAWCNTTLFCHMHGRNCSILKWRHSYLLVNPVYYKERPWIAVISHFAPYSLREGYEMLSDLRNSDTLVVFAVLPSLGEQLLKLGYCKVGETQQYFAGMIVDKVIYTNHPDHYNKLASRLEKYGYSLLVAAIRGSRSA